jgi:hypothetical protein
MLVISVAIAHSPPAERSSSGGLQEVICAPGPFGWEIGRFDEAIDKNRQTRHRTTRSEHRDLEL